MKRFDPERQTPLVSMTLKVLHEMVDDSEYTGHYRPSDLIRYKPDVFGHQEAGYISRHFKSALEISIQDYAERLLAQQAAEQGTPKHAFSHQAAALLKGIKYIQKEIQAGYSDRVTVANVVRASGVSSVSLNAHCRTLLGTTFKDQIDFQKAGYVKDRLDAGDPLKAVRPNSGFANIDALNKAFKQITGGVTVGQYEQAVRRAQKSAESAAPAADC